MFNMGNMMKQAQLMQERLQKAQDEIARMEVTGESGAGMVKSPLPVTTKFVVLRLTILFSAMTRRSVRIYLLLLIMMLTVVLKSSQKRSYLL